MAVRPPRVAEALVHLECRTEHVIRFAPGEPAGGSMVLGRILHVHVADVLLNERLHVDAGQLSAVGRLGGAEYSLMRERVNMPTGRAAIGAGALGDRDGRR
ncbi:MAG: hypothetical protein HC927_09660 [Deltaproteobacteria bacterium]|nr:hypothetical protein [Deltaproteobacteria bacterium]